MQNMRKGAVLVDSQLRNLIEQPRPYIQASLDRVQPCSLDLTITNSIWQVAGIPPLQNILEAQKFSSSNFLNRYKYNSFLPDQVDNGEVTLNPGSVYLIELSEKLSLPGNVWGYISPKSSAGRIDLKCDVIAEGYNAINIIPRGFQGKLFLLVVPQTFPVKLKSGESLVQLRLFEGERDFLLGHELEVLNSMGVTVTSSEWKNVVHQHLSLTGSPAEGLVLHLDLQTPPVALSAKSDAPPLPTWSRRTVDPHVYFREDSLDANGNLLLAPGEFILARTLEKVRIPTGICAEMIAYREEQGEYRSHYAGFFDRGFGFGKNGEIPATYAVCEIRNIGRVPIILSHGQPVAMLRFEYLSMEPENVYGQTQNVREKSHYAANDLLPKYFTGWEGPQSEPVLDVAPSPELPQVPNNDLFNY